MIPESAVYSTVSSTTPTLSSLYLPNQDNSVYSRYYYSKAQFWDDRYADKKCLFDWYAYYPYLQKSFYKIYQIPKHSKILMIGCGNSRLSQQMHDHHYTNIINIDISLTVINQMKYLFPTMIWYVADATQLSYADHSFDCVIDKGTLDALISGKDYELCGKMLAYCMRVTTWAGQLILVTYGSPNGRRQIFYRGLPFHLYDYHQCVADLSDNSTLINLMRGNLGGKALYNIIKEYYAFKKSMREFALVKLLRKNRKKDKQYIIWDKKLPKPYTPTTFTSKYGNQKEYQPYIIDKTYNSQPIESGLTYNPKKQSFVYVYSIRRKLAVNIEETLVKQYPNIIENSQTFFSGDPYLLKLTIQTSYNNFIYIRKVLTYLQILSIPHCYVTLTTTSYQPYPQNSDKILLYIDNYPQPYTQPHNRILLLQKSTIDLTLTLPNTTSHQLTQTMLKLQKITDTLIEQCNLHPCPKTYSFFYMLRPRIQAKTTNYLLKQYWYPTWQVNSFKENQLAVTLSLPPLTSYRNNNIVKQLYKMLSTEKYFIKNINIGYIYFPSTKIIDCANTASLSINHDYFHLSLIDFSNNPESSPPSNKTMPITNYPYVLTVFSISAQIINQFLSYLLANSHRHPY